LEFEVLSRDGGSEGPYALDSATAATLVAEAASAAAEAGMAWSSDPVDLVPAPKLVELIRRSRKVAAVGEVDDGEG